MKIILTFLLFLPVLTSAADLDNSVFNGASATKSKKVERKLQDDVFVGSSQKNGDKTRTPASDLKALADQEFQFATDSYNTGASIK